MADNIVMRNGSLVKKKVDRSKLKEMERELATVISNESYREKAKRSIEEFYNISKRNVDKGKSRI